MTHMTQMISVPCSFPEPLLPLSPVFVGAVSLVSALPCLPSIPTRHLHYSGLGLEYLESIYRHHSTHSPPSVSQLYVTFPRVTVTLTTLTLYLTNNAVAVVVVACCCLTAVVRVLTRCDVPGCCLTTELSPPAQSALSTGDNTLHSPGQAGQTTLVTGPYLNIHTRTIIRLILIEACMVINIAVLSIHLMTF